MFEQLLNQLFGKKFEYTKSIWQQWAIKFCRVIQTIFGGGQITIQLCGQVCRGITFDSRPTQHKSNGDQNGFISLQQKLGFKKNYFANSDILLQLKHFSSIQNKNCCKFCSLSRSWMRKVVGLNPSDAKINHHFLLWM